MDMLQVVGKWMMWGAAFGALCSIGSMVLGSPPADFASAASRFFSLTFSGAVSACIGALLRAFINWSR